MLCNILIKNMQLELTIAVYVNMPTQTNL